MARNYCFFSCSFLLLFCVWSALFQFSASGDGLLGLVGLEHGDGLVNFVLQRVVVLQHVQQLRVVDLQQHAGDLTGQLRVHRLDDREQAFAKHLLLFGRLGGG